MKLLTGIFIFEEMRKLLHSRYLATILPAHYDHARIALSLQTNKQTNKQTLQTGRENEFSEQKNSQNKESQQ